MVRHNLAEPLQTIKKRKIDANMYCVNALCINFLSIGDDGTMQARRRGKSFHSTKAVSNELQTTHIRTRIAQKHRRVLIGSLGNSESEREEDSFGLQIMYWM